MSEYKWTSQRRTNKPGSLSIGDAKGFSTTNQDNSRPSDIALGGWERAILGQREGLDTDMSSLSDEHLAYIDSLEQGDVLLRFAFSPDGMSAMALEDEREALEEVRETLTINNASPELMKFLVDSGKFEDVVWSGHATEEGVYITGDDGLPVLMKPGEIAEMMEGSAVDEMVLAGCDTADQTASALADVGVSTFAFGNEVRDSVAIQRVVEFAENLSLDDVGGTRDQLDEQMGGPRSLPFVGNVDLAGIVHAATGAGEYTRGRSEGGAQGARIAAIVKAMVAGAKGAGSPFASAAKPKGAAPGGPPSHPLANLAPRPITAAPPTVSAASTRRTPSLPSYGPPSHVASKASSKPSPTSFGPPSHVARNTSPKPISSYRPPSVSKPKRRSSGGRFS